MPIKQDKNILMAQCLVDSMGANRPLPKLEWRPVIWITDRPSPYPTDREATHQAATETSKTRPVDPPLVRSSLAADHGGVASSESTNVIATAAPDVRSAPEIRKAQPPPIISRAMRPPAKGVATVDGPLANRNVV